MDDEVELPWKRKGGLFGDKESQETSRPFRPTISSVKPMPAVKPMQVVTPVGSATAASVAAATLYATSSTQSSSSLSVGKHIIHNRFGRGEVLRIEGTGDSTKATVQFENVGMKQLLLKFAKYEVID
jgi:DNA helicase-2/ATP-dependent DNA helicase PcrA